MIEEFSGKLLVQQEPDASSFPSGGIRNTFEARGYSAWDPTSPVFIIDDTLCIPTIFISYTGEALDYKSSVAARSARCERSCYRCLPLFLSRCEEGDIQPRLGTGILPRRRGPLLCTSRPDAHRPYLMGHDSAKNQQMDDHYFGTIPERVQAFMKDLEIQALELGIPCKTRHNEVAPNQFELAPIFEETNLAVDHNMLLMSLMKKIARKHGFRALLHENHSQASTVQENTTTGVSHRHWRSAARSGKTPEDNLTLRGLHRGDTDGRISSQRTAQSIHHECNQCTSSGRQRGTSSYHLFIPRQTIERFLDHIEKSDKDEDSSM